jgi:hypothetical protein
MMREAILAWHWMRVDRRLRYPPHTLVEPGMILHAEGLLELWANGLHGSRRALDALRYAPGFTVARTEHGGEIIDGGDKLCSRTRTALWIIDARLVVIDWLAVIVDRCLTGENAAGRDPDARVWGALTALQRYVRAEASITDVRNATYAAAHAAIAADAAFHAAAHETYGTHDAANVAYAAASATANAARAAVNAARAAATTNAVNAARAVANAARAVAPDAQNSEWERMNSELECRLVAAHEHADAELTRAVRGIIGGILFSPPSLREGGRGG